MCYLSIHTRTEHECSPQVACICGRIVGTTKALVLHFKNHVRNTSHFQCHHCKKFYKNEGNYKNHIATHHINEGEDDDGNSRKFQCDCGKSFKEARHLAVHTNSHLPDDLKFIHICSYCQKRYSSIFSLRQHIKHVHVNVSMNLVNRSTFFHDKICLLRIQHTNVFIVTRCSHAKPILTPT